MLEVKNLSKEFIDAFGIKKILFKNVSLRVYDKKITSVIAPIGAGKTSLLKIISGFDKEFSGEIKHNINNKIFFIPSIPISFPWQNVKENVLFGLENFDEKKYKEIIELVGLDGYDLHIPNNKSYGFRLRILLAQALMKESSIILLDEPFSKLDYKTKNELYSLIKDINKKLNVSFLLATTNITEALLLSDNIFLMKREPGQIINEIENKADKSDFFSYLKSQEFLRKREEIINSFKSLDISNIFSDLIV